MIAIVDAEVSTWLVESDTLASVASTLVGASKVSQIESNIAATGIRLSDDQMRRLDEASAPLPGFTSGLAEPFIRRMVFGGQNVVGWAE
jgi:diketogulonate reductase-like aldo/keto reductase